jgi:hypothetical protein
MIVTADRSGPLHVNGGYPEPQLLAETPPFPFYVCPANGYFAIPFPTTTNKTRIVFTVPVDVREDNPWIGWYKNIGWGETSTGNYGICIQVGALTAGALPWTGNFGIGDGSRSQRYPAGYPITMDIWVDPDTVDLNTLLLTVTDFWGVSDTRDIAGLGPVNELQNPGTLYLGWPPADARAHAYEYSQEQSDGWTPELWSPYGVRILSVSEVPVV